MTTFFTIYFLMSIIVVGGTKPWERYLINPYGDTFILFIIGGAFFMYALVMLFYLSIYHKEDLKYFMDMIEKDEDNDK